MKTRQKAWDCLFPMFFILLMMVCSTLFVLLAAGILTGIRNPTALQEEVRSLPLFVSGLAYIATLLRIRRVFAVDEMRFIDRQVWGPAKTLAASVCIAAGGSLLNYVLMHSAARDIFSYYEQEVSASFRGQNVLLLVLVTVLLGPAAEEIIFRGMTYRRIREYLGVLPAVLLSAALFGLFHGNMLQFLYAFPAGCALAFLYEKSGDLRYCIGTHMVLNLLAIVTGIL